MLNAPSTLDPSKVLNFDHQRVLLFGIGNPGRQDDGLGIRLIEEIQKVFGPNDKVAFDANYQLNVEDALTISEFDLVIFADASGDPHVKPPFSLKEIFPKADIAFSTHAMNPETILAFCEQYYLKKPKAYLLAIPGYEWGISETLSSNAQENLQRTFETLIECLRGQHA